MKNEKKVIEVINKFPAILYEIKMILNQDHADHILDASAYSRPGSLMKITAPDMMLLNLGLSRTTSIEIVGEHLQENMTMKLGMITTNPRAYYMSLCSTLSHSYFIDGLSLEFIPEAISKLQLN